MDEKPQPKYPALAKLTFGGMERLKDVSATEIRDILDKHQIESTSKDDKIKEVINQTDPIGLLHTSLDPDTSLTERSQALREMMHDPAKFAVLVARSPDPLAQMPKVMEKILEKVMTMPEIQPVTRRRLSGRIGDLLESLSTNARQTGKSMLHAREFSRVMYNYGKRPRYLRGKYVHSHKGKSKRRHSLNSRTPYIRGPEDV